jgi:hypothetical protein
MENEPSFREGASFLERMEKHGRRHFDEELVKAGVDHGEHRSEEPES